MLCKFFMLGVPVYLGLVSLFLRGFLLTKHEVTEKSTGSDFPLQDLADRIGSPNGVFLFVVDALRLDFMVDHPEPLHPGRAVAYNRLSTVRRLLQEQPARTALFTFRADPPTVTSQRLQALTTGGMPTFLDIRGNMGASTVVEDSWPVQLAASGKRMVHMGDDTWLSLYPDVFNVSFPFDSFNTKDIHGVDNGIESHLFEEMEQPWDLFVAHFLGVDHVGHTHSAFHPLMQERLDRMDVLLAGIVERLPAGAALLLFGDHGMTDAGEHGGASEHETDSGLFVYRKPVVEGERDVVPSARTSADIEAEPHDPPLIMQIDLVPTLSLAMGLPVPFSSLGAVAPLLLARLAPVGMSSACDSEGEDDFLSLSLYINSMQVVRYLSVYSCTFHMPLPLAEDRVPPGQCSSSFSARDIDAAIASVTASVSVCTGASGQSSVGHRTTFPVARMENLFSILFQALRLHKQSLLSRGQGIADIGAASYHDKYLDFLHNAQELGRDQWTQFDVPCMASSVVGLAVVVTLGIAMIVGAMGGLSVLRAEGPRIMPVLCYVAPAGLLSVWHSVSMLSNSFIIEEHHVALFAVQVCSLCLVAGWVVANKTRVAVSATLGYMVLLMGTARCMWNFRRVAYSGSLVFSSGGDATVATLIAVLKVSASQAVMIAGYLCVTPQYERSFGSALFLLEQIGILGYWLQPTVHDFIGARADILCPRLVLVTVGTAVLWLTRRHIVDQTVSLLSGPDHALLVVLCSVHLAVSAHLTSLVVQASRTISAKHAHDSASRLMGVGFAMHCVLLSRLAYISSGQRLDFGSLHLSVGFIGVAGFHFFYAGALLICHMVGFDVLAAIAAVCVSRGLDRSGSDGAAVDYEVTRLTLMASLWNRILVGAVASACGLLHRRHLMVWAVFAPKILFEVFFSITWIAVLLCLCCIATR